MSKTIDPRTPPTISGQVFIEDAINSFMAKTSMSRRNAQRALRKAFADGKIKVMGVSKTTHAQEVLSPEDAVKMFDAYLDEKRKMN